MDMYISPVNSFVTGWTLYKRRFDNIIENVDLGFKFITWCKVLLGQCKDDLDKTVGPLNLPGSGRRRTLLHI